jgi:hypothetical protein
MLLRMPPGSTMDVGLVQSLDPLIASLRTASTPNGTLGGGAPGIAIFREGGPSSGGCSRIAL